MTKAEKSIISNNEIMIKISELIESDRIKKIIFLPSGIQLWNIKSNTNNKTYWIDLDRICCSCKGFYYNFTKGICYHIKAAIMASESNKYNVEFQDDDQINNHIIIQFKNVLENDI